MYLDFLLPFGLFGCFGEFGHNWPFYAFGVLRSAGRGQYAAVRSPWGLMEAPRTKMEPLGTNLLGTQGDHGAQKWPKHEIHPTWPGPIDGVQDHQDPGLPKVAGEDLSDEFSPKGV